MCSILRRTLMTIEKITKTEFQRTCSNLQSQNTFLKLHRSREYTRERKEEVLGMCFVTVDYYMCVEIQFWLFFQ
jgi:hypothetical protein